MKTLAQKEAEQKAFRDDLVTNPKWGGMFVRDDSPPRPEVQPTAEGIEAARRLWEKEQQDKDKK